MGLVDPLVNANLVLEGPVAILVFLAIGDCLGDPLKEVKVDKAANVGISINYFISF
jgi:hypothetical protein